MWTISRHRRRRRRFILFLWASLLAAGMGVIVGVAAGVRCHPSARAVRSTGGPPSGSGRVQAWPARQASVRPDAFQTSGAASGSRVPAGFVSLSVEAQDVADGSFTAQSPGLVSLLRGLRPGFLRVGANTGDAAPLAVPALTRLARLASAVPVPVVLQLPLREDNPGAAVREAVAARGLFGSHLEALEIGNEPDAYGLTGARRRAWTYAAFTAERNTYRAALAGAHVRVALWGPSDSGTGWLSEAATDRDHPYRVLTQHFYPLSRCHPPAPTIRGLLSVAVAAEEQGEASLLVHAARSAGVPVVLDETNSVSCYGGQSGVSNTSAAGLWALDYGLIMARAGVRALAFHVPLAGCAGYSPICFVGAGAARHWVPSPEYDGLRALTTLTGDRFAESALISVHHHLRTWALTTPADTPVLVALDLDPAHRGEATLSWRRPLASPAYAQIRYGSPLYASTSVSPFTTATDRAPARTASNGVTVVLRPGTATVLTGLAG